MNGYGVIVGELITTGTGRLIIIGLVTLGVTVAVYVIDVISVVVTMAMILISTCMDNIDTFGVTIFGIGIGDRLVFVASGVAVLTDA